MSAFVAARNLTRTFDISQPWITRIIERRKAESFRAVDDVSFEIAKGETFALVGESGSGKTTIARMVVGLIAPTSGEVTIDGVSMTGADSAARRALRRRIQMVFQDPYASLNPRWRVEAIIAEPLRAFGLADGPRDVRAKVGDLLRLVGLHPDDGAKYPHRSPAGSASASPSPARWRPNRISSAATSRHPRSTSRYRRKS